MASANNKVKPRRVDFFSIDQDYDSVFLGSLGFSTRCIQHRTKLSPGQITYRLKKAAVRRIDYRDGTSDVATMVMRLEPQINKQLVEHLRKTLHIR